MNILPKKRWHVRTKDNIARVRRDEAAAQEEEIKRRDKLQLAESEARINFLRQKSELPERHNSEDVVNVRERAEASTAADGNQSIEHQHVDLFADYRYHSKKTNKALEKEKKEERETYEKKIGYLTYLGQDTNEALKVRSWYEVAPKRAEVGDDTVIENDMKNKQSQDPLTLINALLPADKSKLTKPSCVKPPSEESITAACTSPTPIRKSDRKFSEPRERMKHKKSKKHKSGKHKRKKHDKKKYYSHSERRKSYEEEQRLKREKLEMLRKQRLRREASERARQEALVTPKIAQPAKDQEVGSTPRIVQKYNNQFNPELAKQNMA